MSLTHCSPFPVAQDHDGKLDTSDHAELVEFIKPKKTGSEVVGLTQLEPEPEFDLAAHPEHEVDAHKLAALSIKNYKLNQRDFQLRVSHAKEDSTAVARLATSHSWHTSSTRVASEEVRTVLAHDACACACCHSFRQLLVLASCVVLCYRLRLLMVI